MRSTALAAGVVVLAAPSAALADISLHALLESHLGITDNVASAPEGSTRSNDGYLMLRPGFLMSWETRRTQHEMTASSDLNMYAANTDTFSMAVHGRYRGAFLISPRSGFELGASGGSGTVTELGARTPAGEGQVMVLPTGGTRFVSATADEQFAYQASEAVQVFERGHARWVATEVDGGMGGSTSSTDFGGGVGGERAWQVTAIGVEARASLASLGLTEPGLAEVRTDQLDVTGVVTFRRDLNQRWTTRLEAGLTRVIPVRETTGDQLTEPTVAAAVIYNPEWAVGSLEARHAVQPNLFLAANTITDSLTANAALPLPWLSEHRSEPRLSALFTVGGLRTRFISLETGTLSSSIFAISVDAAMAWTPRDNIALAARIQFVQQSEDPDMPMPGQALDVTRTALLLTFSGRWPDRVAAETRGRRDNRRVDRSNIVPIGDDALDNRE